jgi:hypothetical protein
MRRFEFYPHFGLTLELLWHEDHHTLAILPIFGSWYFRLPKWKWIPTPAPEVQYKSFGMAWGFTWPWARGYQGSIYLKWGNAGTVIQMPWAWKHYRTDILQRYCSSVAPIEFPVKKFPLCWYRQGGLLLHTLGISPLTIGISPLTKGIPWEAKYPYKYVRKSGQVQERVATVRVEEREWRCRWLMWSPWPSNIVRSIDVSFNEEVGEGTGSWKGGCVGCGYDMLAGETPEDTLRRMERERKFT